MRGAIIGLMALGLVGCATPAVQQDEGKALTAAWTALDAVSVTLDGLAKSHTLTGEKALMAADYLQKASAALTAATNAYKAGDNATAAQNVAAGASLVTSLIQIAQNSGA